MTDANDLANRLDELESRFAFQQETLDSLNEIVTQQWNEIARLKKRVKILDSQMYELEVSNAGAAKDVPPPHY